MKLKGKKFGFYLKKSEFFVCVFIVKCMWVLLYGVVDKFVMGIMCFNYGIKILLLIFIYGKYLSFRKCV